MVFLDRFRAWWRFYRRAVTLYRVHSPFVFAFMQEVLDDRRRYYAFGAIESLRARMWRQRAPIEVLDLGAGPKGRGGGRRISSLAREVRRSGSGPAKGAFLFRLTHWLQPAYLLELGTSVGISTLYISAAAGSKAHFTAIEGCPNLAAAAQTHLALLGFGPVRFFTGAFETHLDAALASVPQLDLVFLDGNHQEAAVRQYFDQCVAKVHAHSCIFIDDIRWSKGMENAWRYIQEHPAVRLTIDCPYGGLVFFNPDFKVRQHFTVVPWLWKMWVI